MEFDLAKPFIHASVNVVKTLTQFDVSAGEPFTKVGNQTWGEVTGIIGLAGEGIDGNMAVSFELPAILAIVSKMLMEDFHELSDEVIDAVGELTNMICGGAKKELCEHGLKVSMATPVVLKGKGVEVSQVSKTSILAIPFSLNSVVGQFVVEENLHVVQR